MQCPFLKETRVKFCQASPFRKMIVQTEGDSEPERCSTPKWVECTVAQKHLPELPVQSTCPFLQERLVQYCSTSPVTKFIPYNEAPLSRCKSNSHKYCELYLELAHPDTDAGDAPEIDPGKTGGSDDSQTQYLVGIRLPDCLSYAANHMWLDKSEDGTCHIGVDGFLTKVLGGIDRISFVTEKGINRPAAMVTVNGVDLELIFPKHIVLTGSNSYLRAAPEKLTVDPYGAGWLFTGYEPEEDHLQDDFGMEARLYRGAQARRWMQHEVQRLNHFVHEQIQLPSLQGKLLMADGGECSGDFLHHLSREEIMNLYNNFFSPYASWRIRM
jgi:glycine cleavage system H lipoate-binding protein